MQDANTTKLEASLVLCQSKLRESDTARRQLQQQLVQLQEDNARVCHDLKTKNETIHKLEAEVGELKNSQRRDKDTIAELQRKLDDRSSKTDDLLKQVESQRQVFDKEQDRLVTQYKALTAKLSELEQSSIVNKAKAESLEQMMTANQH